MLRFRDSKGYGFTTEITDLETGQRLHLSPRGVTLHIAPSLPTRAELTPAIPGMEAPLVRELDLVTRRADWVAFNPATGRHEPLAALVFRDGTQIDLLLDGGTVLKPGGGTR